MNRLSLLVVPFAASLLACGADLGKGGTEEGTAGSFLDETQYTEQATVCPGSSKIYGIDVSYYQGTINWAQVKAAGKVFAIIRVSDGTGFMDPKFVSNWKGAKAAGLAVGAYQFFRPTQDVTRQADIMVDQLNAVGFGAGDIPPVIDVEVHGRRLRCQRHRPRQLLDCPRQVAHRSAAGALYLAGLLERPGQPHPNHPAVHLDRALGSQLPDDSARLGPPALLAVLRHRASVRHQRQRRSRHLQRHPGRAARPLILASG
jgi:hypothetical protein